MSAPLPVICLAGPTGCGKTAAAIELAQALDAEIVNADSRQVYADFPCITAQPSAEERAACPHHLYGFLPTEARISAGRWAEMAADAVRRLHERGKRALLVGGTGLYFQTLLRGIADIPPVAPEISARWTQRLAEEGPERLHAELGRLDPAYAARIHPHDRQRIVRALEVQDATGKPFSWWHEHAMSAPLCAGPLFSLAPTLDWLEPRLARRIDLMLAEGGTEFGHMETIGRSRTIDGPYEFCPNGPIDLMLAEGALEEARAARRRNDDPAAPGWSGIGCAEVLAHLRGELSLADCRALWLRHTRAYAKRQLTWFRGRREAIHVLPGETAGLLRRVREALA